MFFIQVSSFFELEITSKVLFEESLEDRNQMFVDELLY